MKPESTLWRSLVGLSCIAMSFVLFVGGANLGVGVHSAPNPLAGILAVFIGLAVWFSGYWAVRELAWERTYRALTYSLLPLIVAACLVGTIDGEAGTASDSSKTVRQGHSGYVGPFPTFGIAFAVLVWVSLLLFHKRFRFSSKQRSK